MADLPLRRLDEDDDSAATLLTTVLQHFCRVLVTRAWADARVLAIHQAWRAALGRGDVEPGATEPLVTAQSTDATAVLFACHDPGRLWLRFWGKTFAVAAQLQLCDDGLDLGHTQLWAFEGVAGSAIAALFEMSLGLDAGHEGRSMLPEELN